MSLLRCTHCDTIVDTDEHPESFWCDSDDGPQYEGALCWWCKSANQELSEERP